MKNLGKLPGHTPKAVHVNNSQASKGWLGASTQGQVTKNVAGPAKSAKTQIGKPMKMKGC